MQKKEEVKVQRGAREVINSCPLFQCPQPSVRCPNPTMSGMKEVFVESSGGSRFPDQLT